MQPSAMVVDMIRRDDDRDDDGGDVALCNAKTEAAAGDDILFLQSPKSGTAR